METMKNMETENQDMMENVQALIGDELEKYHESKIKRDQGQETNPRPRHGMKPVFRKKFPQALLQQYLTLN